MRKLLLFGGCLAVAALALSACGSSESDEDQIASAIETSATSTDAADCTALNTIAFLEQTELGAEGQEAVKSCEEEAKDPTGNPDSVTVAEVEVDGSNATAEATFVGGNLDGQTLAIGLIEEDGEWKLDQLESFVEFDRAKLLNGLEEAITGPEGLEEPAACVLEELKEFSDEEVEEVVLSPESFLAVIEGCE